MQNIDGIANIEFQLLYYDYGLDIWEMHICMHMYITWEYIHLDSTKIKDKFFYKRGI